MKVRRSFRTVALCTVLSSLTIPAVMPVTSAAQTQENGVALQRGFRTGYSDGYMSGYRDVIDSATKSYTRHADYAKADRAYSKDYGALEDYRDGYQQGFEAGYETGFDRKTFESALPSGLKRRGVIADDNRLASNTAVQTIPTTQVRQNTAAGYSDSSSSQPVPAPTVDPVATNYQTNSTPIIIIPRETELIVELQDDINTEQSREGEKFTAKVVSPSEIAGATIEGRVAKVLKPGRLKRRSELSLSFDRIILDDSRWSNFGASMVEVIAVKGDNIKRVDSEGTALGQSSLKNDAIKLGGTTGAGALIGGVVGGPVGVAVGAGVGAAFGVGAVVIERGKHVRLTRNQQVRIKTAYQTQIR